ncbi:helix-turn-helix transcriptional regulator [Mucilaginibacter corticis]|uniref:Helix-turn-helix transcriptional regulator n=1 Tax=Mucilaginibacter corticis TaxID=2597670 RepID=A0A556MM80_9SPHI|nr:helix-turn-helix transcriptional regulator [Mucilaginibacter corticis]TSJ41020.1 helix-turn-helix transcriptional regulator [Mucilaginibacter corticis]
MKPHRIKTISEYHRHLGLPKPEHPLISVVTLDGLALPVVHGASVTFDFYFMGLKRMKGVTFKYGQHIRDYDESLLFFMAPKQVLSFEKMVEMPEAPSGFLLLIHPDFLWNTTLGKNIKQYEFFDYAVNEGLFLTEKEQAKINSLVEDIRQEYVGNIDNFSQDIMLSHVETLLNYSQRYYHRQFLTRKKNYSQVLDRLEKLLNDYFTNDIVALPTVAYLAENLNVSPSYLSSMLRTLTGQNTQQHIHDKLIEKAKEKLSTTDLSVSEIAYTLGFEHLQSFSKLFKNKTNQSPLAFRASFN